VSGTADRHTRAIGRVLRDVDRIAVGGGRAGQQGRIGRGWKKTAPVCGGVPVAASCISTRRRQQRQQRPGVSNGESRRASPSLERW